ncbi:ANTAR domain-containing protein [Nocardioides seonyuensis]|uniref:ANTAR domain-containing protein n=1 Tax=Nocardioides seonyuensis TaxID=2518371 RepID=A0A4V1BMR1_9ACTN|nr:ANTAR domain-containing protein [Nocardioides seonyuensis]QBX57252.1 ANTAR domain-containing protein [Nocardioides seonyuensis]
MSDQRQGDSQDLQSQIDALTAQIGCDRAAIETLQSDAADTLGRIEDIEAAAALDRQMIAELQDAGVVSREHAAQMERALQSSRTIGTAVGILMAEREIRQDEAFTVLKAASRNSNRKLREVAQELVESR